MSTAAIERLGQPAAVPLQQARLVLFKTELARLAEATAGRLPTPGEAERVRWARGQIAQLNRALYRGGATLPASAG